MIRNFLEHPTGDGRIGLMPGADLPPKGERVASHDPPRSPYLYWQGPDEGPREQVEAAGLFHRGDHGRGGLPSWMQPGRLRLAGHFLTLPHFPAPSRHNSQIHQNGPIVLDR
jgi:hypothetical protein